ncbi:unnamed protein product, partial [Brachionus calyciflorus]
MILFNHSSLQYPVSTPFLSRDLTPLLMLRLIERVSQSNKNLKVDENLEAIVTIYQNPIGKGRLEEYAFDCKSVRLVRNNDGYCLVRALLISKAHLDKDQKYNELCRINSPELDIRTLKIVKDLNFPNDGCGNKEIEKIERYFGKYQNTVNEGDAITKEISYLGRPNNKFLYIWRHKNHYDTNCIDTDKTDCPHCFFKCRNTICKRIHLEKFCQVANQCEKCSFLNTKRHVCGFDSKWCKNCKTSVDKFEHKCYILTEDEKKKKINKFEVCKSCLNIPNINCFVCEEKQFETNEKFCDWLIRQDNYIAIAHNMKAYDGVFILNYIVNNLVPSDSKPN